MLDHFRPLAIFSTVAETGSFRLAAERLGLSPSVVSHHVSKLEERYDVALLYRSTRQLTLTTAGQDVLEHGIALLDAGARALDVLQADLSEPQGLLRITAPAILEHGRFMDDLAEFMELNPKVDLELNFSDERIDLIAGGYDLALRGGSLDDSDLMSLKITSVEDVICASPKFIEKHGEPASPEDLVNFKLIGVPPGKSTLTFHSAKGPKHKREINVVSGVRVSTGDAALSLAIRGAGIARLPRLLIETQEQDQLVDLLPGWSLSKFDIHAIWPRNVGHRSLTRIFVDFLRSKVAVPPQKPPI